MHTSATPRPFSSLSTVSQNLADSPVVGPAHRPSTCLCPSQSMPMATYTARLVTTPSLILVLSLILWWSAGQEYAFSQHGQAGAAEHLAFEHFEPVDVALHWAGAVGQGQAVADGVEVAAQVSGECCQRRQGVVFDVSDPGVEAVAVAAGHHRGQGPDKAG